MVNWFTEIFRVHKMDSYQIMSQIAKAPIANVVDANYSVVVKAAKALMPKNLAYEGMHQKMRERAKQLR
jgi:DNA-binding transcriptional regulator GbsR (MarR family)